MFHRKEQRKQNDEEGQRQIVGAHALCVLVIDFSLVSQHTDSTVSHEQCTRACTRVQNIADIELTEDLIARRKDRLEQHLFMFDRDSSIVPILGNYDLPKTLQAR